MAKPLPKRNLSGAKLVKILKKFGFSIERCKGSHIIVSNGDVTFPVPGHKELSVGTINAIYRQAGVAA